MVDTTVFRWLNGWSRGILPATATKLDQCRRELVTGVKDECAKESKSQVELSAAPGVTSELELSVVQGAGDRFVSCFWAKLADKLAGKAKPEELPNRRKLLPHELARLLNTNAHAVSWYVKGGWSGCHSPVPSSSKTNASSSTSWEVLVPQRYTRTAMLRDEVHLLKEKWALTLRDLPARLKAQPLPPRPSAAGEAKPASEATAKSPNPLDAVKLGNLGAPLTSIDLVLRHNEYVNLSTVLLNKWQKAKEASDNATRQAMCDDSAHMLMRTIKFAGEDVYWIPASYKQVVDSAHMTYPELHLAALENFIHVVRMIGQANARSIDVNDQEQLRVATAVSRYYWRSVRSWNAARAAGKKDGFLCLASSGAAKMRQFAKLEDAMQKLMVARGNETATDLVQTQAISKVFDKYLWDYAALMTDELTRDAGRCVGEYMHKKFPDDAKDVPVPKQQPKPLQAENSLNPTAAPESAAAAEDAAASEDDASEDAASEDAAAPVAEQAGVSLF
eukprot:TRINITY_DN65845_c1_g1_i1.p1 TRINITY_DN65845_c1_g1~~TRINITY_DN65845_c1_g1_i1.p1  ORF type:complete len:504 (-),score=271.07 TRINITY_DN65845_c1_g1_i1:56-1567(-)